MSRRWLCVTKQVGAEGGGTSCHSRQACRKQVGSRQRTRMEKKASYPRIQKTRLAGCKRNAVAHQSSDWDVWCANNLMADDPTAGGDYLKSFTVRMDELQKHVYNFKRHMSSGRHVKGLLQWQSEDDKVVWRLPPEEFNKCLDDLRKGCSAREGEHRFRASP